MADANELSIQISDADARNEIQQTPTEEGNAIPSLPPQPKKGKKRSHCWLHFTEVPKNSPDAKPYASCNWCGVTYACDSKANETRNMIFHLESQCTKYPLRNVDNTQTTLGFKPKKEGTGSESLMAVYFSVDACRQALAEMVIIDELPFKFVEGEGFRRFMFVVQPKWTKIPSRITVAKDCGEIYLREKNKLMKALKGQRICLTTDTWTSLQNLNYMCLTAHYIDNDWKLHKKIINFCVVESHKGETLGKVIEECLIEWKIDSILTITVDNASSNNGVIRFLKRKTKNWKGTILEHEFLHMRCCAHILNLIVRDGLKDLDEAIVKVRKSIKYVRSSPERLKIFKKCAEKEKIMHNFTPCLDVPTRWNYTYLMLDMAEKFQKAFERLEEDDSSFRSSFREVGCDEDVDENVDFTRSILVQPLDEDDWKKTRLFVKFLKLFHDATLSFSGTKYVTCNSFFMELVTIQDTIDVECREGDASLKLMVKNMKGKFEKYWGNFDNMNPLLYVGLVLDPRYKLQYVEFCFGTMYDTRKAYDLIEKVKKTLNRLFEAYVKNEEGDNAQNAQWSQPMEEVGASNAMDMRALRMSKFKAHLKEANSLENKSEVEKYLAEGCEDEVDGFDILDWWKINYPRFRILSTIARHVLAIPVSTVASESAFSTAGRVLTPFRSSLCPRTVETLICTQNWLRSSSTPINIQNAMNDVEEFEKIESELMEKHQTTSSIIVD